MSDTSWSRRRLAHLGLAVLGCAALSFAIFRPLRAAAAEKGPIRIGFLTVKTGALAAGGRQMEEGLALYLDAAGAAATCGFSGHR